MSRRHTAGGQEEKANQTGPGHSFIRFLNNSFSNSIGLALKGSSFLSLLYYGSHGQKESLLKEEEEEKRNKREKSKTM